MAKLIYEMLKKTLLYIAGIVAFMILQSAYIILTIIVYSLEWIGVPRVTTWYIKICREISEWTLRESK